MSPADAPRRITLVEPEPALAWLEQEPQRVDLAWIDPIEMWGLVGLATLARKDLPQPVRVELNPSAGSAQFAHAVGFDEVVNAPRSTGEFQAAQQPTRTVKLSRIHRAQPTEPAADRISRLLAPPQSREDTRQTLYYVLNELFRNVVQHSQDPLGGVVGAQVNRGGRNSEEPMVQVAVADAGIGIPESLRSRHTQLSSPRAALDKALWPHISSTFDEGETGSAQNAGMGLFFISEMTKLVGGRLLIATRGASLLLEGDRSFENPHGSQRMGSAGFPGTLVAFEMPSDAEQDYAAIVETIKERAKERTPRRAVHQWLKFEAPPSGATQFLVRSTRAEDTAEAQKFAESTLIPRLLKRESLVLDFRGIPTCTQSYVHALLFEPLRLAWARKTPVYIANAAPAVRSTLELLENYALGG